MGIAIDADETGVEADRPLEGGDDHSQREGIRLRDAEGYAFTAELQDLAIITDVALDPYNSDGHDRLVADDGVILNDETAVALWHDRTGATFASPSDMMDGRVGALRAALDAEGFHAVGIMSYTAKPASACYGTFRSALDSAPKAGDKKTYQMDSANAREAVREAMLDGAKMIQTYFAKQATGYLAEGGE